MGSIRFALLLAASLATLPARADTREAYEEVLPSIAGTAATAHPESPWHADWQRLHGANLEFTAMLLGFYRDRELVLKLRNLEPVLWSAELSTAAMGGALKRRLALRGVNISHSGTLTDVHLPAYLADRGVSRAGLDAGRRYLFVDGTHWEGSTYRAFLRGAFGDESVADKVPFRVMSDTGARGVPHAWTVLQALRPGLLAGGHDQAGFDRELDAVRMQVATDWEFSTYIPHYTGNSDLYEQRDGKWRAMARTDRQVVTADQLPTGSPAGERVRAVAFMEDLKAYFTRPDVKQRMADRIRMWRGLRARADRGDAAGLADALDTLHVADPAHAEAVARDLVVMLRAGHTGRRAPAIPEAVGHARQASPLLPRLVEHLRSLPKTR